MSKLFFVHETRLRPEPEVDDEFLSHFPCAVRDEVLEAAKLAPYVGRAPLPWWFKPLCFELWYDADRLGVASSTMVAVVSWVLIDPDVRFSAVMAARQLGATGSELIELIEQCP